VLFTQISNASLKYINQN